MSRQSRARACLVVTGTVALCYAPTPALAHLVQTGFGTFYDGATHLVLTPADLLVVLGFGLLAGLSGAAVSRPALFALPLAWLVGGLSGSWLRADAMLPWLTTLSFGLVGVLVAANARLPRAAMVGLACAVGLLHGYDDGATMLAAGADRLSVAGAATTVFILMTLVAALVVGLRAEWTRIAVRVAGSWIAAAGLLTLGWLARR